tara:strand:+ start:301 stop:429 length:129 start_codon:yes stop_codon:yes gene_type:complete
MIDLIIIGFVCVSLIAATSTAKKEQNNNYIQCKNDSCEEPKE